jgi:outer membrane receptor protein involved in Fe transport
MLRSARFAAIAIAVCAPPAFADELGAVAQIDTVRVTASWAPLSAEQTPQSLTVVDGDDLRARGARDLRSGLALVCGVEAVPGGDSGPAGAVPALWGLREFDAFLLVVDGIPWGGAFIPNLPTLDLSDVDRIEVLRGPAPVTYGSTSFVGVIHVFHRHPGAGESAEIAVGSYETVRGSAALNLGGFSRLEMDGARERFRDEDAGVDRGHARYRMDLPHDIQADVDGVVLKQDPTSPVPRVGAQLDPSIPLDANHNPIDARLDTNRWQLSASQSMHFVNWNFAASHADDDNTRGFLQEGAIDDGSTPNAVGYTQERKLTELYGQAHHRFLPASRVGLAVGVDALFGKGEEESENFQYYAPLNGNPAQRSSDGVPTEETEFEAERTFLGLFAEADWHPAAAWTVLAGARLNYFDETREGEAEVDGVETPTKVTDSETRPSGRLGITWRVWESNADDDLDLYVNAQDTFKPAAVDFGPEAEVEPLDSETARSIELGARTDLLHHRLHMDASVFRMDFENLVVSTFEDGLPKLDNAGTERFDGVELGAKCDVASDWSAIATYAWHDATFLDYEQQFGGVNTSLDGNQLEMSPHHLVSAGLQFHGTKVHAEVFSNYIGERFLNKRNTAKAEAYSTIDASAGAKLGRVGILVAGRNLSDRRDPVAESELGEAQYYRLTARVVEVSASITL